MSSYGQLLKPHSDFLIDSSTNGIFFHFPIVSAYGKFNCILSFQWLEPTTTFQYQSNSTRQTFLKNLYLTFLFVFKVEAKERKLLEELTPLLENLSLHHNDVKVKEMANDLRIAIATHGAVWSEQMKRAAENLGKKEGEKSGMRERVRSAKILKGKGEGC